MSEHSSYIGMDEKVHAIKTTSSLQEHRIQLGKDHLQEARRILYKAKLDTRGRTAEFEGLRNALEHITEALKGLGAKIES